MTIHIEGFEEFAGEAAPASAFVRADYTVNNQWAMVAGRSLGSTGISARGASLSRKMAWTADKFAVGFAHIFDARGSAAWLKMGAKQVVLWLNPDTGLPTMNDHIGGAMPTANRWYYYELEIDRALGVVNLFINNRFDSAFNFEAGAFTEQEVEVSLGYIAPAVYRTDVAQPPSDTSSKTYDDFYMRDGARIGPITVTTRFPTVDKHVEWFAADPTKPLHADSLALHPPKPLDNYVASNVIGKEDRFTSGQPLNNANSVIASGIVVLARKSPNLNAKLGVFMGGQAGADLRQDTRTVESDWRTQYVCFEQNQNDTVAGITAADFGIKVSP